MGPLISSADETLAFHLHGGQVAWTNPRGVPGKQRVQALHRSQQREQQLQGNRSQQVGDSPVSVCSSVRDQSAERRPVPELHRPQASVETDSGREVSHRHMSMGPRLSRHSRLSIRCRIRRTMPGERPPGDLATALHQREDDAMRAS